MDQEGFSASLWLLFFAFMYYLIFGSGIILYILVILGILCFIGSFSSDTEEKAVVHPESNECPDCERKKREGANFCNICGRSL